MQSRRARQGRRVIGYGLCLMALLGGCNATSTVHDSTYPDMRDIYDQETGGRGATGADRVRVARQHSRWEFDSTPYTRDAQNDMNLLFQRLPNPVIYLYIDPHLRGGFPVPGYTTAFPLYDREHWALPHEAPTPVGVTGSAQQRAPEYR